MEREGGSSRGVRHCVQDVLLDRTFLELANASVLEQQSGGLVGVARVRHVNIQYELRLYNASRPLVGPVLSPVCTDST